MRPRSIDNIAGHQFRWLRAIRDGLAVEKRRKKAEKDRRIEGPPARLTEADMVFAVDLTEYMQGRLECFRSAAALAEACGLTENAADAGLRRLVAAGFLTKLPAEKGEGNGKGRPASRYRIPDIFPILGGGNVSPSCVGENAGISPSCVGTLSPSCVGNDQRDDQNRAKAPTAPSALISVPSVSDVDSENGGYGADDRANPPFDDGPKEDDEPIIVPPDDPRPFPEIPASLEEEWRRADEQAEPPEPSDAEDDADALAEVENLIDTNPAGFVDAWERGFIACDAESAEKVLAIVARVARRTTKEFPSYPDAVEEFLIAPLLKHLATIAEGRGYDPETVANAVQDFRDAFDAAPGNTEQERRVTHG